MSLSIHSSKKRSLSQLNSTESNVELKSHELLSYENSKDENLEFDEPPSKRSKFDSNLSCKKNGLHSHSSTELIIDNTHEIKAEFSEENKITTEHSPKKNTKIWTISELNEEQISKSIKIAGKLLLANELIAFPTETVYGLGANAFSDIAAQKIFKAKGRPSDNPLIVHISLMSHLYDWILTPNIKQRKLHPILQILVEHFWPGPLSIVIPYEIIEDELQTKYPSICNTVRAGLKTVAIRMPSSTIACSLISSAGCPIAAPSANISGKPSPTHGKHVIHDMDGKIAGIIDAGELCCAIGLESTVIKMNENDSIVILRPGGITKEMIAHYLQSKNEQCIILYAKEITHIIDPQESNGDECLVIVESPGMKYKHYSPEKPLFILESNELFVDVYRELCVKFGISEVHQKIGFLISSETQNSLVKESMGREMLVECIGSRLDLKVIAGNLFKCLRAFDDNESGKYDGISFILAENFVRKGIGIGIMNRLSKAASLRVIRCLDDIHTFIDCFFVVVKNV